MVEYDPQHVQVPTLNFYTAVGQSQTDLNFEPCHSFTMHAVCDFQTFLPAGLNTHIYIYAFGVRIIKIAFFICL